MPTTAIVAATKERATQLARDLGVDSPRMFGANSQAAFEGLRVDLVLVDAEARIPNHFLNTIHATVAKTPGGRVRYVSTARQT